MVLRMDDSNYRLHFEENNKIEVYIPTAEKIPLKIGKRQRLEMICIYLSVQVSTCNVIPLLFYSYLKCYFLFILILNFFSLKKYSNIYLTPKSF